MSPYQTGTEFVLRLGHHAPDDRICEVHKDKVIEEHLVIGCAEDEQAFEEWARGSSLAAYYDGDFYVKVSTGGAPGNHPRSRIELETIVDDLEAMTLADANMWLRDQESEHELTQYEYYDRHRDRHRTTR